MGTNSKHFECLLRTSSVPQSVPQHLRQGTGQTQRWWPGPTKSPHHKVMLWWERSVSNQEVNTQVRARIKSYNCCVWLWDQSWAKAGPGCGPMSQSGGAGAMAGQDRAVRPALLWPYWGRGWCSGILGPGQDGELRHLNIHLKSPRLIELKLCCRNLREGKSSSQGSLSRIFLWLFCWEIWI